MCSFRPLGSYLAHLQNKLLVPLPKGPPCSHTKNMAQESIPVLTVNVMRMWEKQNKTETKKKTSKNLKARSSFTDHSVLFLKFYRSRKLAQEVNVSLPNKHYIVDPSQILKGNSVPCLSCPKVYTSALSLIFSLYCGRSLIQLSNINHTYFYIS